MLKRHQLQHGTAQAKKLRINTQPLIKDIWVNKILPLVDKEPTISKFNLSCRFFHDMSDAHYRLLLARIFKDRQEDKLEDELRVVIASLHQPRSVYKAFKWLLSDKYPSMTLNYLHLVCNDLSSPTLWHLLDDDVDQFLASIQRSDAIDYITTAIIFERTNILNCLLPFCIYQYTRENLLFFLHAAVLSCSEEMINRVIACAQTCNIQLELNKVLLSTAIYINKPGILRLLLHSLPLESQVNTTEIKTDLTNQAVGSGNIEVVRILSMANLATDLFSTRDTYLYAIRSGNLQMFDYLWGDALTISINAILAVPEEDVLIEAIESGNPHMLTRVKNELIKHRPDLNPEQLITADELESAAYSGKPAMFDHILQQLPGIQLNSLLLYLSLESAICSRESVMVDYILALSKRLKIVITPTIHLLNCAASVSLSCYDRVLQLAAETGVSLIPTAKTLVNAISSRSSILIESIILQAELNKKPIIPSLKMLHIAIAQGNIYIFNRLMQSAILYDVIFDLHRLYERSTKSSNPLMSLHLKSLLQNGMNTVYNDQLPSHYLSEPNLLSHCCLL